MVHNCADKCFGAFDLSPRLHPAQRCWRYDMMDNESLEGAIEDAVNGAVVGESTGH